MALSGQVRKMLTPLYQKSVVRLHELTYLFLELTHACNLACIHCGSDCVKNPDHPDLPAEDILTVLHEVRRQYSPEKISVVLTGGEPLCYPGLFTLTDEITRLGFPWGMVTNGYGWSLDVLQKAYETKMGSVTVSLDGLEEEHNWLRGKKDAFEKAVYAIQLLTENPFYRAMDVVTCVNRRNLNTLDTVRDLLISLGVKKWRLFIIDPIGRANRNRDLFLSSAEFRGLLDKIVELRSEKGIDVSYSCAGYLDRYEYKVRDYGFLCQAGISISGIMINGDILACPNIDRKFSQGNIYRDSFIDTWEKGYQLFRNKEWTKTGVCSSCREWKQCRGNSMHLRDAETGTIKYCHYRTLKNG